MEKSKRNIFNYPLVIGFLLLLILPVVNSTFKIWEFERDSENRAFQDSLSININHLDLFPEEAENYMNDNFSFRKPLLDIFHKMKFYVFKTSPHPDKLTVGKNGWYFMAGDEQDNYLGLNNLTSDTLELLKKEWKRRMKYFNEKGIKVYWMIAPTAHHVYSDQLPFHIQPKRERRVSQVKNYFDQELPGLIIDPMAALISHKKNGQLYYKQDNHWNYRAGQIVNEEFVKRLRKDFPSFTIPLPSTITWHDTLVFDGIHHRVLGIKTIGEVREIPIFQKKQSNEAIKYNFPVVPGFQYGWNYERRFLNDQIKKGLRIVVIRDSFSEQVMPFMSESFAESVFIFDAWQYKLNQNIIETVQPDVVLFLTVESLMESIAK